MSYQSVWYFTDLPEDVVNILERDISETFDSELQDSKLAEGILNKERRNSMNAWIPTEHWVGGFLWHYIQKANRQNFMYDLSYIDNESIQYTQYNEGQFYGWHNDSGLTCYHTPLAKDNTNRDLLKKDFIETNTELIRKLSFVLQLSDADDYEGGNLQLLDETGRSYFAPRKRGTVILFDSRTQHRVLKVTKGIRKSLVGWTVGPRWK